jgi:MFS family permease
MSIFLPPFLCALNPVLRALPALYGVALFLPTIIASLGYSNADAQLLSVPPFVGASLYTVLVGWLSDRTGVRGPFIACNLFIEVIGYALAYTTNGSGGQGYAACMICALGAYSNISMVVAWLGGNAGGEVKRGVVLGLVIGVGNFGGCVIFSSSSCELNVIECRAV